jgi:hypothetical protein
MKTLQKQPRQDPEFRLIMAISNELSSEIAAAILVEKKSPKELNQLKDVILRVHSTLQKMSEEQRAARAHDKGKRDPSETKAGSA